MAARKSGLKFITTAAAVGLLWSQAATAASPLLSAPVDPLVALSALSTTGSSSAVCGTGGQSDVNGCVLAANDAAQPAPPPQAEGPPPPPPPPPAAIDLLPLLIALGAVVAVAAILASGSSHGSGNLSPVSPA